MKEKAFFMLIGVMLLLHSCGKTKEYKEGFPIINTESAERASISDLFFTKKMIPLETSEQSLIGLGISRIESFGNKIFLLNNLDSRRNILCFNLTGHFLYSIDKMGNGPEEYTYLGDFVIDKYKKEIILGNSDGDFQVFDLDGNYLRKKKSNDKYFNRHMIQKNDSVFIAYNSVYSAPYGYYLLELESTDHNIKRKANEPFDRLGDMGDRTLSIYNNRIIYYNSNDTIYDVTDILDQKPLYYINMGEKSIVSKDEILNSPTETLDIIVQKKFDLGELKIVTSIFENNKWVAISTLHYINDFVYNTIFYNKETQISYNSENIDFGLKEDGISQSVKLIGTLEDGSFCCLIYDDLRDLDMDKVENNWGYPIEANLQINTDEDNPVLFILK